jgi:hypothetical protein
MHNMDVHNEYEYLMNNKERDHNDIKQYMNTLEETHIYNKNTILRSSSFTLIMTTNHKNTYIQDHYEMIFLLFKEEE